MRGQVRVFGIELAAELLDELAEPVADVSYDRVRRLSGVFHERPQKIIKR
jgi:hypothetical protein